MTREEKIKGLYSLKEYLGENPIELEGHKSLPITLIDNAIEALEQEPKSEWEQDHEILKAYSDGYEKALEDIRAEIDAECGSKQWDDYDYCSGLITAKRIIDKHINGK